MGRKAYHEPEASVEISLCLLLPALGPIGISIQMEFGRARLSLPCRAHALWQGEDDHAKWLGLAPG